MIVETFPRPKATAEVLALVVPLRLAPDVTIVGSSVVEVDALDVAVGTSPLTLVGSPIAGTVLSELAVGSVTQYVSGGTVGSDYLLRVTADLSDGSRVVRYGRLRVR